jgi:hypothetical protein
MSFPAPGRPSRRARPLGTPRLHETRGVDHERDGPSDVRAGRADRCHPLFVRRSQRGDVRPGLHRLLGHLLRRTGRATGPGPGRDGGCALLQLRSRRSGPPHPEGVGGHDTGRRDRRSSGGLCDCAAADPRGSRRHARVRTRGRPPARGGDQRADRRSAHVRRTARAPDPRRGGGPSVPCRVPAAGAPWRRTHRSPDDRGRRAASRRTSSSPSTWTCPRRSSDASTTSPPRSSRL